jgi:hypothetical protein
VCGQPGDRGCLGLCEGPHAEGHVHEGQHEGEGVRAGAAQLVGAGADFMKLDFRPNKNFEQILILVRWIKFRPNFTITYWQKALDLCELNSAKIPNSEAKPTIMSCNATVVKIYNATNIVRFGKNYMLIK